MTTTELTRGTTFKLCVEAYNDDDTAINFTGWTGKMKLVRHYGGDTIFDITDIVIDVNKVTATVSATETAKINETTLLGTLQVEKDGEVIKLEDFKIIVNQNTNV